MPQYSYKSIGSTTFTDSVVTSNFRTVVSKTAKEKNHNNIKLQTPRLPVVPRG